MIKQGRFFVNLTERHSESAHSHPNSTLLLFHSHIENVFLTKVNMALIGGEQGGFASRLFPPANL